MKRVLCLTLMACTFLVANIQPCHAIVWFSSVARGEVPSMVQTPALRKILATVPPLGGTATEGSWNNCTLYYRGTEDDLQKILDRLSNLKKIQLVVLIDKTGKAGRVEPEKYRPLPRTLVYQFSISFGQTFASNGQGESVSVVVHKSAGIDPANLKISKDVRILTKPSKEKIKE